jgi:hypothetical protein
MQKTLSPDAQQLKSLVDAWRPHAPKLRVTYLQDGESITDKRKTYRDVAAHLPPEFKGKVK